MEQYVENFMKYNTAKRQTNSLLSNFVLNSTCSIPVSSLACILARNSEISAQPSAVSLSGFQTAKSGGSGDEIGSRREKKPGF